MKKRSLRLPTTAINLLRDLRDSHTHRRPIPRLIHAALRQTKNVALPENKTTTPYRQSEKVAVVLDEEFCHLPSCEIRERVLIALKGLEDKTLPEVIKHNRQEKGYADVSNEMD